MIKREGREGDTFETVLLGDLVQRINDLHLTYFRGESIEWEIEAKSAIIRKGEEAAAVKDMHITYIPQGGTPINLSAEKGRYNLSENTFFAEKVERDVDIKIGLGLIIKGSEFTWLGDERKIYGPGKIRVIGESFALEGEDLVANVDNGIYEISKNIRATMWE